MKYLRRNPFIQGGQNIIPTSIPHGMVKRRNAKIFGWKGALGKTQNVGNVTLDGNGCIEEKNRDLRLLMEVLEYSLKH